MESEWLEWERDAFRVSAVDGRSDIVAAAKPKLISEQTEV
jgi:hypothetical protein